MVAPRLGLIIPANFGEAAPPTKALLAYCSRAEELGFDSLWVIDRLFHQYGVAHPMVMLSQAAAVTSRIGLGTGVILLSVRHPVEVAQRRRHTRPHGERSKPRPRPPAVTPERLRAASSFM